MDDCWDDLVHDLALDLGGMEPGQFVIVQHCAQLDPNPYVQAAPERGGGWYCEVVSEAYLPAEVWPIDEWYLLAAGWTPPADPRDNWSRTGDTADQAVELLADGLRFGRVCPDWQQVMWRIHRFPCTPDDDRDDPPAHPPPGHPEVRGRRQRRRRRPRLVGDSSRPRGGRDSAAIAGTGGPLLTNAAGPRGRWRHLGRRGHPLGERVTGSAGGSS